MCVYHCPSSWLHLSVRLQLVCQGNKQSIMNFVSLSTLSPKVSRVSDDTTSISSIDIGDQAAVRVRLSETLDHLLRLTQQRKRLRLSCAMEVCLEPNQTRKTVFPKKNFGQAKPECRSFKTSWFDNWLHWDAEK